MDSSKLSIRIVDFKAIHEAEIEISGITVIAGINGSGKSTISRSLYHAVDLILNYDTLLKKRRLVNCQEFIRSLSIINRENLELCLSIFDKEEVLQELRPIGELSANLANHEFEVSLDSILKLCDDVKALYDELNLRLEDDRVKAERSSLLLDKLNRTADYNVEDLDEFIDNEKKKIASVFDREDLDKLLRPRDVLDNSWRNYFEGLQPKEYEVKEDREVLWSREEERVRHLTGVKRSIYIDTPMALDAKEGTVYWERLKEHLKIERVRGGKPLGECEGWIKSEVLGGDAAYDYKFGKFQFTRSDDRLFNLLECATGLKAFALIQMLLANGELDKDTLLIVDEPEAHLHPQWIVEYARLLVLLRKYVGVRSVVTSHSPDFIRALRDISEREKVLGNTNFYLADKMPEADWRYSFRSLEQDIEPIFESFNIALDLIEKYAWEDEDDSNEML